MNEEYDEWPDCSVPECVNKCCLRLNSDKCWPHTVGAPTDHQSTEIEREIYELGVNKSPLEVRPNAGDGTNPPCNSRRVHGNAERVR